MKNRDTSTVSFHKEYEMLLREWQAVLDTVRASSSATEKTPQQIYQDALKKRAALLEGVQGLDETEARDVFFEGDREGVIVPFEREAMKDPEGAAPAFIMADAPAKYLENKGIG
ncbi:MAG: hypothetical protein AAF922_19210 [Pseudomonadota bacterium]